MLKARWFLLTLSTYLAYAYPLALLAFIVSVRFGAEHSTFLSAALYLPPHGYLIPLVLALPLLVLRAKPTAFLALLAGGMLAVFGPMGVRLNLPSSSERARVVVTMNVDSAYRGIPELALMLLEFRPDLVLIQEVGWRGAELESELKKGFPFTLAYDQFVIASRFAIDDFVVPNSLFVRGRDRIPRFIRVRVAFPEGPVAVYNAHPISPRPAFIAVRGNGFRSQIKSGRIWGPEVRDLIWKNVEIRRFELSQTSEKASQETMPVLIGGDLNMPNNSRFFSDTFGHFQDAFAEAGFGAGYTFPAKLPFLRLDRLLVSPQVRVLDAKVACKDFSDHLCLVTKLEF